MKRQLFSLLILPLIGVLVLLAADAKVDYNKTTDFSQYKTYSWIKVQAGNTLWADRITRDVDGQLTAKGLAKVESGGEAGVAGFGATHNQPTLETFYTGFHGGWFWRGFGDGVATTTVENTPVGTLVVDIFDNNTKKLIWRASGQEALSGNPEKNENKLEKVVEDMFKHFPPRSKG